MGQTVQLSGWVQNSRVFGENLVILSLRDGYGTTQIVFESHSIKTGSENERTVMNLARNLKQETIVTVKGTVRLRGDDKTNPALATGEVEICADYLGMIASPEKPLPLLPSSRDILSEDIRLQNRPLDLRREIMQRNLRLRSLIASAVRNELLDGAGTPEFPFVEVETPTLFRSTPEGAREFLVPTRFQGKFYALTQSPQQYKQLLVTGGIDRYFQLARCYRDESGRADRQPEFTQIDIEMGFVRDTEEVMRAAERVFLAALSAAKWAATLQLRKRDNYDASALKQEHERFQQSRYFFATGEFPLVLWHVPPKELPRLTYGHALSVYGSDKPDRRLGMPIANLSSLCNAYYRGNSKPDDDATTKLSDIQQDWQSHPDALATALRTFGTCNCGDCRSLKPGQPEARHCDNNLCNQAQPHLFQHPKDPSLEHLASDAPSVRAIVCRGLGANISRKELDALAVELRKALSLENSTSALPVTWARIGEAIQESMSKESTVYHKFVKDRQFDDTVSTISTELVSNSVKTIHAHLVDGNNVTSGTSTHESHIYTFRDGILSKAVPLDLQQSIIQALRGNPGDMVFLSIGKGQEPCDTLGVLRPALAAICRAKGLPILPEIPLFEMYERQSENANELCKR